MPEKFGLVNNLVNQASNYTSSGTKVTCAMQPIPDVTSTGAVCTASVSGIPLLPPMTRFEDRRTQPDMRVSKIFRLRNARQFQVNVDVYNVMNASTILGVNKTYGRNWLLPVAPAAATEPFLQGRLIEIGGQFRY